MCTSIVVMCVLVGQSYSVAQKCIYLMFGVLCCFVLSSSPLIHIHIRPIGNYFKKFSISTIGHVRTCPCIFPVHPISFVGDGRPPLLCVSYTNTKNLDGTKQHIRALCDHSCLFQLGGNQRRNHTRTHTYI